MARKRNHRFLVIFSVVEKRALEALAQADGVTQAGTLRRLLRREARERGFLQEPHGLARSQSDTTQVVDSVSV